MIGVCIAAGGASVLSIGGRASGGAGECRVKWHSLLPAQVKRRPRRKLPRMASPPPVARVVSVCSLALGFAASGYSNLTW
jgi:hypothetical protein